MFFRHCVDEHLHVRTFYNTHTKVFENMIFCLDERTPTNTYIAHIPRFSKVFCHYFDEHLHVRTLYNTNVRFSNLVIVSINTYIYVHCTTHTKVFENKNFCYCFDEHLLHVRTLYN